MAIDYRKFAKEFLNVMKEEAESNNRRNCDSCRRDEDEDDEEFEVEFTSVSTNSLPDGKKGSGK